jgi:phosphoribosylanthranilate isomerase
MRTRTKICGITNASDRDAAVAAGADALGFIVDVSVDTPREVETERARRLVETTPPFVTSVVVTMPDSLAETEELLAETGADAVQVHGEFAPGELETLGEHAQCSVFKVVEDSVEMAERYDGAVDALVVDTVTEGGGGGSGETHDWERSRSIVETATAPVVLAGGLTPDNVGRALEAVRPYAVDVATGVEASGGKKDHGAVRAFVREVGDHREVRAR